MAVNRVYSAGAVIYRKDADKTLFLVVYSGRNRIWGFPKGNIEEGEGEKEAALREVMEETGLDNLATAGGFREETVYMVKANRGPHEEPPIEKHAIYFLCRAGSEEVVVDGREITGHAWLGASEAEARLSFENLRAILRKADKLLKSGQEEDLCA